MKLKKNVSLLLSMVMILCLLPMTVGAAELPINGNKIDIADQTVGPYSLQYLEVYLQDSYEPVSIVSAEQNGTVIDIALSSDTDPSAKLQAGFSGTSGATLGHQNNKCTLSDGIGTMSYAVIAVLQGRPVAGIGFTINFKLSEPQGPAVKFTTNLSETEKIYVQGKTAEPLTVCAAYTGGESSTPVTYQWYRNAVKSTDGGEAIEGATSDSFIPAASEIGTTYYYAVASCEGFNAASKIATVTVEAPSIKILTNLGEAKVEYIQDKTAEALVFSAEYTGLTENPVIYQWYKNTEKTTDNGEAIEGATSDSFIPETDELGTIYYYATAFCENLCVTSKVAEISVIPIPVLTVTDNVIDITDKTVYSRSSYYAKAVNIKINGADVEKATEDGTTVNIVLDGTTGAFAEIEVEFGTELNRCTMSGHIGSVKLNNGEAQLVMPVKGQYQYNANQNATVTYTLNFSLGEVPDVLPTRLVESDSASTYTGVALDIDLSEYFSLARKYYLVAGGQKAPLESNVYSFKTFNGGTHTLIFAASNDTGDCPDLVTVTVNVTEIKSGAWLGIETSNGNVNYVLFKDVNGEEIEGLTASIEGNSINVNLPHSYDASGKVTATFDLIQNSGLPFITTQTGTSGTASGKATENKFTEKTTTLSSGSAVFTFYLYNSNPTTNNNNYSTYTINYALANTVPALAEGQAATASADITAGDTYTLDLSPIFTDADGDALTYSVKINGEAAVAADAAYSFVPTIGGKTYTLEFFANDFMSTSAETYTVTLDVANVTATYDMTVSLPSDITPAFYITNGYENGVDVLGNELEFIESETADGITSYTVSVPENISEISVRDSLYGGMAFHAASGSTVVLQKVATEIIDFGDKAISGSVEVSYGEHKAVGVDGRFLLVQGNEYTFSATPENTSKYNAKTDTLVLGADASKVSVKVAFKNPKTVKTTTGATVKLFRSSGHYFAYSVYDPEAVIDNGDGTSTYYFAPEDGRGVASYRVSMEGKLTKAGYFLLGNSVTVPHGEDDNLPTDRVDYTTAGTDAAQVGDDSVLININQQNHLSLNVGETKTLKAYRTWQIITYSYENHIIEPDFHFNIISGDDVVSLTPCANQQLTNSSGNHQKLTAVGEGTAVVEVTYDAIDVKGGAYEGFYGAVDPARTGLFVVTVGTDTPDVDFGIECKTSAGSMVYTPSNAKSWDAEFDTLYFFGESGEIKLSPTFAGGNITEVAVSGDKGESYTVLDTADGIYTAPIVSGNNIIRVTTDKGVAYQIVRGDKVDLVVKNETDPGKPLSAGDEVSLMLVGVHTPIPKIAGTYNPGYKDNYEGDGGVHLNYTLGEETVKSNGVQYTFSLYGTTVKFTVPEDSEETEFTLTDGYIGVGVIGVTAFPDDGTSHRNISDSDSGTRGSETTFHTRSMLPDITVSIGMFPSGNTAPLIRENAPKTATLNLGGTYALSMSKVFTDRDNDELIYTAKIGDSEAVAVGDGYYTFTPDAVGVYTIEFTANDGTVDSDIHTVTLTVKEKQSTSTTPTIKFDIDENEIDGYVKVSFEDKGKRVEGEKNITYPKALGTIISSKKVPYTNGDTVADVTLRLLDAYGFTYEHSGTTKEGFYLASIGDFTLKGIDYDSFGEFDAGEGSGWMITLNDEFIEYGASEFEVESGDVIRWQYTCQLGADIGDPFWDDDDYTPIIRPSKPKDDDKEDENKETEDKNEEEPKTEDTETDTEKLVFTETTFDDVSINDWFYESVKYVYENSLMQGTDVGFEPDSKMTRAMLVTVLYRLENAPTTEAKNTFTDVPNDEWYTDAVIWAKENGIVTGVTENEFAPNDNVTREQMATIIFRYAKFKGCNVNDFSGLSDFSDSDDVSGFAVSAMSWAYKSGIIKGTTATTLSPKDTATRAQVATILMRFSKTTAN